MFESTNDYEINWLYFTRLCKQSWIIKEKRNRKVEFSIKVVCVVTFELLCFEKLVRNLIIRDNFEEKVSINFEWNFLSKFLCFKKRFRFFEINNNYKKKVSTNFKRKFLFDFLRFRNRFSNIIIDDNCEREVSINFDNNFWFWLLDK